MKTKLRLCAVPDCLRSVEEPRLKCGQEHDPPKPWLRGTVRALVEIWLRRQQAGHQ